MKRFHSSFSQLTRTLLVLLTAFPNLSATWQSADYILTDEDLYFEGNQNISAISSPLNETSGWESFEEWRCYFTDQIDLGFSKIETDPEKMPGVFEKTPTISASDGGRWLEFDYDHSHCTGESPDAIQAEWKELLAGERAVCIYAAYLQDIGESTSYWYLSGIKTSKGYWPSEKSMFFSTSKLPSLDH